MADHSDHIEHLSGMLGEEHHIVRSIEQETMYQAKQYDLGFMSEANDVEWSIEGIYLNFFKNLSIKWLKF